MLNYPVPALPPQIQSIEMDHLSCWRGHPIPISEIKDPRPLLFAPCLSICVWIVAACWIRAPGCGPLILTADPAFLASGLSSLSSRSPSTLHSHSGPCAPDMGPNPLCADGAADTTPPPCCVLVPCITLVLPSPLPGSVCPFTTIKGICGVACLHRLDHHPRHPDTLL